MDYFISAAVAAFSVYMAFYILFPKVPPWPVAAGTFLFGVLVTSLVINSHPQPFIDAKNSINWNLPQWLDMLAYLLQLLTIGPFFAIFIKNFFHATTRAAKNISLVIAILAFVGIVNVSILFTPLVKTPILRARFFAILMGVIGLIFIIFFFLIPAIKSWHRKDSDGGNLGK